MYVDSGYWDDEGRCVDIEICGGQDVQACRPGGGGGGGGRYVCSVDPSTSLSPGLVQTAININCSLIMNCVEMKIYTGTCIITIACVR